MADQYMTVGEARDYLGVSRAKMTRLIESGELPAEENPLDKRSKKVRRADVEKLKQSAPERRPKNTAA
jgi:excisionase family DNA binding protein